MKQSLAKNIVLVLVLEGKRWNRPRRLMSDLSTSSSGLYLAPLRYQTFEDEHEHERLHPAYVGPELLARSH
jgi:hypothetical protein